MSSLILVAALMAAPHDGSVSTTPIQSSSTEQPRATPLAPHQLRNATSAALRRAALAREDQQVEAYRKLVDIYGQLEADTRMARSSREVLMAKVRIRLMKYAREKSAAIAKARAIKRRLEGRKRRPASIGLTDRAKNILAQQIGGVAGGLGGPGQMGGQGGQSQDDGEELIELIQTTISPDHWDANGGPGSIVYFGSLHVMVVRASDEVHGDLGNVLQNLRKVVP